MLQSELFCGFIVFKITIMPFFGFYQRMIIPVQGGEDPRQIMLDPSNPSTGLNLVSLSRAPTTLNCRDIESNQKKNRETVRGAQLPNNPHTQKENK